MTQEGQLTPSEVIAQDPTLQQALGFEVTPSDFHFGVKVKIYNAEMRSRRLALGLTQKQLAERAGLEQKSAGWRLGQIEGFYRFPEDDEAQRIAQALGTERETIFPKWLQFYLLGQGKGTIYLERSVPPQLLERVGLWRGSVTVLPPASEMRVTEDEGVLEKIVRDQLRERLTEVLTSLTPRERKILILRFGLADGQARTSEEVGREFHLSGARIRQIEAKALKKLRHPARLKTLEDFLT